MNIKNISLSEAFAGLSGDAKFAKYRELWALTSTASILPDFPLHLDVELSGVCNLRCEKCFQNGLITNKLGIMDVAIFHKILEEAVPKGLCGMKLQVRGESLLHPQFFDLARAAKDAGIIDLQLTTNGTLLSKKATREALLNCGLDGIIFSYDEHHDAAIERGLTVDLDVKSHVQALLNERKASTCMMPWVRIQRVLQDTDAFSVEEATQQMRAQFPDADRVLINKLHNFSVDSDSYEEMLSRFKVNVCSYPFQRMVVYWEGAMTVCCNDYNNNFDLGRVDKPNAISHAWMSPRIMKIRDALLQKERQALPICKHCHVGLTSL